MKIGTVCPTVSSSLVSVAIRCRALFTWAIIGALPVGFVISMSLTAVSHDDVSNVKHADKMHPIFRWSKAQDHNIREYGKSSAVHLDKIQIPESFTCKKTNCSNIDGIYVTSTIYLMIYAIHVLKLLVPVKKSSCQDCIVPGWYIT